MASIKNTGISRWAWPATLLLAALASCVQAQTNVPPSVSIVAPLDSAVSYTTNALIIDVQASDPDGTVAQVGLYRDGLLIAMSDSWPYEFELINVSEGSSSYTASATDNSGATTFSGPVHITVLSQSPAFYAPSITLSAPTSNAVVIAPTNMTLIAQVTDRGYPVKSVRFTANNLDLGTVTEPPFVWTITNIALGSYTFTASAADTGGYEATSPAVPVTVIPNPATTPAVSIASPTNGASVPVGQDVQLAVTVITNGNVIQRVDFYAANNLVGSVYSAPYSLTWRPSVVGPSCWSASAVYGQGQSASSPQACINVALIPGSYPQSVVVDLGPLETNNSSAYGLNSLGPIVGD